jgi:SAM-dependent methyltransferase
VDPKAPREFDPAIAQHYEPGFERLRLAHGAGPVEEARTREVVAARLPTAPARVLDVGGGPGAYARWLEDLGHDVTLVDPVPLHVEQARATLRRGVARIGDARRLDETDASVDAVLLLGPLYHLPERADRLAALAQARRVVRPCGPIFVAAISRFASAFDGMARGHLDHPAFARIVEADLRDGRHRNEDGRPEWFTTAYFHRPEKLREELESAGLAVERIVGLEGPTWLLPDVETLWADPARRERWSEVLRALESEPSLLGVSAHLLAVARRA